MSLQISGHGTREGVLSKIAAEPEEDVPAGEDPQKDPGVKLPLHTDPAQIKAVKALLATEIAQLPAEFNGCRVVAEASAHAGARTIQITIFPLKLHL